MDEQKYFPTLVIGLGGTGSHIAGRIREKMLANSAVKGLDGTLFVFAGIDTDIGDLSRQKLEPQCQIQLSAGMDKIGRYIKSDSSRKDERRTYMANFVDVDNNEILDHDLSKGAGQFRALSRAAWELGMNSGDLKLQLDRVIERIRVPAALDRALSPKPEVYIVASVAGGTGSGASLLLGRYIKNYLETRNLSPIIKGVLLLPDIFCHSPQLPDYYPGLRANGYGYLKELEMTFMERLKGKNWVLPQGIKFMDGLDSVPGHEYVYPFKYVYLVGEGSREFGRLSNETSYEPWERLVAQAIYSRILSPGENFKTTSAENNIIDKLIEDGQDPQAPPRTYSSLGSSCLMYSTEDAVAYLGNRKIIELVGTDWSDIDKRYRLYQQEEQKKKIEGLGLSKPRPQYMFYIESIENAAQSESASPFMKLIHREVVRKIDNIETNEDTLFVDALSEYLEDVVKTKMLGQDEREGDTNTIRPLAEDSFEDLSKSDMLRTVEKIEENITKYENSLKEKLTQYQSECFRNIVFGPSGVRLGDLPQYSLGRWIPGGKSIFGVRYFVSLVLNALTVEYESLGQDYPRLERKLKDLKDFDSEIEGQQTSVDSAVKLPERKGILDLSGKRKYSEFVGKFVGNYNSLLSNLTKYYETALKRWVIGKLIDILGESSENGGLLNLIYGATARIMEEKERLERDLGKLANENTKGLKEYENVVFVFSDKAAREHQWTLIQPQLASDPTFNEVCYRRMSGELYGLWSMHQVARTDPEKRAFSELQNKSLGFDAGEAVSKALFEHVALRINAFPEVGLSVLEAVRREAELRGDSDTSGKTSLSGYVDNCIKRAAPLINLKNTEGMKSMHFLTCYNKENAEIADAFKTCLKGISESDAPQIVGDSFYGKNVAIFSRTALCFRLPDTLLLDPLSGLKQSYNDRGEKMGAHVVRSFFRELPDPDPVERANSLIQFGKLLMFDIIVRDETSGEFRLGIGDNSPILDQTRKAHRTYTSLFGYFRANREKLDNVIDVFYRKIEDEDLSRPDFEKGYPCKIKTFLEDLNTILRSNPAESDKALVEQLKNEYLIIFKKYPIQYQEFIDDPKHFVL